MLDLNKFAALLVDYCLEVKPKQVILVNTDVIAIPLVEELYKKLLLARALPKIEIASSRFAELFYEYANNHQLEYVSPSSVFQAEHIDAHLAIRSNTNTKTLANIDMRKQKMRARALFKLNQIFNKKRWTLTLYPTEAYAQDAEMSLREFSQFVSNALFLNVENPIQSWLELSLRQEGYIDKIKTTDKVHIRSNGIDLNFSVKNRLWINSDGKQNMPSGEIYTTPIEDSVNGYFKCSFPNTKYGREIDGVSLEFKGGRVCKITADKNEDYLIELLNTDKGAKTVGEFGIGLNYGITTSVKNILFDEKIGGTIHIALGQTHEKTGGKNKSNIHLDLIADLRDSGEILFNDELLYRNGKFLF